MTKIAWNKPGQRRYADGVDRGVLYLPDGSGVAWNGLTSVEEDLGDVSTEAYYFDGTKYLITRYPGDYSGTLKAMYYPDEFLQFDGYTELNNGVLLGHQPVYDSFGLCYRTKIGNDIAGMDHGYQIHILYNLVATPDNRTYNTLRGDQTDLNPFSWKISGVPEAIPGHRPTVHIVLDTTRLNPFLIRDVEDLLYGTDDRPAPAQPALVDGGTPTPPVIFEPINGGTPSSSGEGFLDGGDHTSALTDVVTTIPGKKPTLPPLSELVDLLNSWVLIDIVDNGDGTWTATGPDEFIKMLDPTKFQITSSAARMIDSDTYEITTAHTF